MSPSELRHTVYIQKMGDVWECAYINRNGKAEAVRRDLDTLNEAQKYASDLRTDVYYGQSRHSRYYPARPEAYPEEYPPLPLRADGSIDVDVTFPDRGGYHFDGRPRSVVKGFFNHWLDEDVQDDREKILNEAIRDLEKFSEINLANKLEETRKSFFQKQEDARERCREEVREAGKRAAVRERNAWIIFWAPLIALGAITLGRLSAMIF